MHIIAHRGASAYEPENTLRAFERALALGGDWIELDLRLSRDGHLLVSHSDDLAEATNGTGLVSTSDLHYIRSLDAGSGERIPTFAEVIECLRGRCGLYVELKAPGTAAAAGEQLRRSGLNDGIVLASF